MGLQLTSTAFEYEGSIPARYTCDDENVSPPLGWEDAPEETGSFALVCEDPDAPGGMFVHWVVYEIGPDIEGLPVNVPPMETTQQGFRQGRNDFKSVGYGGPCPPPGDPHRYFFKLYALDGELDLKPGATRKELLAAMDGRILAEAELMGKYRRRR